MWLDLEIRQQMYPNCSKLAEHFEISLRQANRDLEYLKNTLNAPVRYVAVKRGYTYTDMTFILPNLVITNEEKHALSFLAHRYDNFDGTENSHRMANLFRSLSDFESNKTCTPVFSINDEKIEVFHKLKTSISMSRKIDVSYVFSSGEPTKLILHPYQVLGKEDTDYLVAYCEEYGDVAVFRLDRMINITESTSTFIRRYDIQAEDYVFRLKKKPFKAIVRILPEAVLSNLGDKHTLLEENKYEIEFYDIDQLIRELMISDQWSEILSPSWLCEKLKTRCKEISDKIQPFLPV